MDRSCALCLLTLLWLGSLAFAAGSTSKPVIVQMFEWTWDSIAAECTQFLGPYGYGYVQLSPAQEHIQGSQWYTDYQPVSYNLISKRGDRSQFTKMIATCHSAGVLVIADAVFNHMTSLDSGIGVAGSPVTHYQYGTLYMNHNFHHCNVTSDGDIHNYGDRAEVQTCMLLGLADLATETEYVRNQLATYANDLLSLGIDGLRYDAAKHIAATDLANISSRLIRAPYITSEVIYGYNEAVQPSEYTGIGDVQEFRYTSALESAFLESGDNISNLRNLDSRGWVPGTGANVFVANHDTERNGLSLNYSSPSNTYLNAMIFSLAHPYGRPTILSSYQFTETHAGAPNDGTGTCVGSGGANGWLCQHRYPGVAGMVGFRNTVGTGSLVNWNSPNGQQISFGRGAAGYVVINNADSPWTAIFSTPMPNGIYCDVVQGPKVSGACAGPAYTVFGGKFFATIPARTSLALHIGALSTSINAMSAASSTFTTVTVTTSGTGTCTPSSMSSTITSMTTTSISQTSTSPASSTTSAMPPAGSVFVTFIEQATVSSGQAVYVVGSIPQLANWAPANAIAMAPSPSPTWIVQTTLPANTYFEYKFIKKTSSGSVQWESDPNRNYRTPASGSVTLTSSFK